MENKLNILLGGLLVGLIGMLSMVANYPKMYSPYSFAVVMPTLFASSLDLPELFIYLLGVLPLFVFYLAWSFFTINQPYAIAKSTIGMAALLILLSVAFNVISYEYGVQYQGQSHTLLMYCYSVFFLGLLAAIFKLNRTTPTFYSSLSFNIVLFSWLGWVAFPWLGELI